MDLCLATSGHCGSVVGKNDLSSASTETPEKKLICKISCDFQHDLAVVIHMDWLF